MTKKNESAEEGFLLNNLKALLQEKIWLLDSRLQERRGLSPYKSLTDAEARVLATLQGEELTISEVARRLAVSRQAVHKIISMLIERGLLQLQPIDKNLRDKRITFTQAGNKMKKEAERILRELEQEVATAIGTKNLRLLKSLLAKDW